MILLHVYVSGRSTRAKNQGKYRDSDESVRANFVQYDIVSKYLDVVIADASKHDMWAHPEIFDAIVTDRKFHRC